MNNKTRSLQASCVRHVQFIPGYTLAGIVTVGSHEFARDIPKCATMSSAMTMSDGCNACHAAKSARDVVIGGERQVSATFTCAIRIP